MNACHFRGGLILTLGAGFSAHATLSETKYFNLPQVRCPPRLGGVPPLMHQRVIYPWFAVLAALFAASAFAVSPPGLAPVPDFDRRPAAPPGSEAPAEARAAEAAVRTRLPGVRIEHDPVIGAPRFVASTRGFLTGPGGEGRAVAAGAARAFGGADRWRGLKAFLAEHRGMFGHGAEALAGVRMRRDYTDAHNGLRTAVWQQELDGVPVFHALLKAHTTARGELVNVASGFVPDPAAAAEKGVPARAASLTRPVISAAEAVAIAASDVGEAVIDDELTPTAAAAGAVKRQTFKHPALADATAEYVWLPLDRGTLRLCWQVIFASVGRGEMFLVLVDAETGEALLRHCLTHYISPATYNIFTSDSPSPFSPGHPGPSGAQPLAVARTLVTTQALDTTASPNGWIDDGVNETRGNNVDAHTDLDANNAPDTPRPQGSPFRVFNPPLDLAQPPSASRSAAVVQLFYLNNVIHDRLYQLGFTEAAGNFQTNNFGRGGVGNDAVQADAQDGSGTNNANFSTPPDGSAGRMQMFLFTGPTPDRDGDFDAEIVIHEYTHGLSNRLVGGGVGISALQPSGMGEGWSDFYGLCLLSEPTDAPDGNFAAGAYASYQLAGLTENYYYGIRRYPYSTDLAKNPLTFKDIDPTQASAHTGVPRSPIIGNTAAEVHNLGEVWCVTLWEARARLIARHGAAVGNQLILQLVTDGMKLSPANPTFLDARDAILQADEVNNAGANRDDLWAAFAKRGMGSSAVAPASGTTTGVIETFDLPDTLDVTPRTGFLYTGFAGGPFQPSQPAATTLKLTNAGNAPLGWTATRTQPWLTISQVAGTLAAGDFVLIAVQPNAAATALAPGTYGDTITLFNSVTGALQTRVVTLTVLPPRVQSFNLSTDPGWTRQGQWAFGDPTGQGGAQFGFPDPNTGATGANVFGVNLTGDYSATVGGPFYLTTGAIDLSARQQTRLRFQRWLNTDFQPYATARVEVSRNGTAWTRIFDNGTSSTIEEGAWTAVDYDISAVADRQATVFVRWSYSVGAGTFPYSGWNIDDVELLGNNTQTVTVTLPASGTEGGGSLTGTVTVSPAPPSTLTVNLTSTDHGELTVPASITIPAGAASAAFTATILDDGVLDGSQTVLVAASATGYSATPGTTIIHDRSTATLALDLPATLAEGGPAALGRVTLSAAPASDVVVSLASSDVAELTVPAAVVVPAGQTSAAFPVMVVDDDRLDGARSVTVTAQVVNWTPASRAITTIDNDTAAFALTIPAQAVERQGTVTGTLTLAARLATPLVVALASDNAGAATVPATLTVPASVRSATFTIAITNDAAVDGTQTATITASASGFAAVSKTIEVLNDDADHFGIARVPSPQLAGAPFTIVVTAYDAAGQPMRDFAKPLTVTAAAGATPLTVAPATISAFRDGVFAGAISVSPVASGVVLTVRDDSGRSASSNPINLIAGTADFFTELFTTDNDLDNQSFLFVPTSTLSGYVVRRQPTTTFFTDPAGGDDLLLTDDTFAEVVATNGAPFLFYGARYPSVFVGSNGYVTFGSGDVSYVESLAAHFTLPRIAALMDDLNPGTGSQVTVKQLADRVAVTWLAVPEFASTSTNSFQIELFFDGRFRITLLGIAAVDGLTGLSRGAGTPASFVESNFIAYPTEVPPGVSELNDLTIPEDGTTPALAFTVFDVETAAADLRVTAASSNPLLVPPGGIVVGGTGADRTVQVTPTANRAGIAVITLTVADASALTATEAFTVTVTPVNDPPVFTKGADVDALEDSGTRTLAGWAAAISAGPLEAGQALTFDVTNDSPALFAVPPAIAPNGTLSFRSAPDAFGSAQVTVRLRDNGGTANGGLDAGPLETFTIKVNAVNDAPSFAAGAAQTVSEDSGPHTVPGWAAAIQRGPADEAAQTVAFAVATDAPELFAAPPAVAPDGTLTFTTAPDAFGSATITVRAADDGGTANGGTDLSGAQVTTIQILAVNDAPTLATLPDLALAEDAAPRTVAIPGIGTGAFNETQPLIVTAVSSNPALVPHPPVSYASPAGAGALLLTVTGDMSGTATITVTVDDGQAADHATSRSFDVAVQGVNDAPSFGGGPGVTVLEDSGAQTVPGWATAVRAGPADEAAQALGFVVTTDNDALFSDLPAITPEGALSFTPAPDANGVATVTVALRDSGGTDGGGVETSPPQTFTIAVQPVNDAPVFALGADESVVQDAGPQVRAGFASAISTGAENEAAQRVSFLVSSDEPALFAVPPAISPAGVLTYVPRAAASGTATVSVRLRDDGDTQRGGVNTSAVQTFTVAVTTFGEETGTYNGLALPAPGAAPGAEKTGLLRLTIGRRGIFTGRLRLGSIAFVLRGSFDKAGTPRFHPGETTTLPLPRRGLPPLTLALALDVSGGSGRLTGALTEAGAPFAALVADRALYTATARLRPPWRRVPVAIAGQYTLLFSPSESAAPEVTAAGPRGHGFGRLLVPASGVARLAGRLADGSALSYANALSKDNVLPIWIPLAHGQGALAGPATFRDLPGVSDLDGPALLWFKPATARAAGWPGGIALDLLGSTYLRPPRGSGRLLLPDLDSAGGMLFAAADSTGDPPFLTRNVSLDARHQIRVDAPAADRLHILLIPATGAFRGAFVHPGTRKPTRFQGALLQKQSRAAGYYLDASGGGAITIEPSER